MTHLPEGFTPDDLKYFTADELAHLAHDWAAADDDDLLNAALTVLGDETPKDLSTLSALRKNEILAAIPWA